MPYLMIKVLRIHARFCLRLFSRPQCCLRLVWWWCSGFLWSFQQFHLYGTSAVYLCLQVQSTLVISNSPISNNRLSRSENLVPVLTQISTKRQQNIVKKKRNNCSLGAVSPLFHNIFNISLTPNYKLHTHSVKGGCSINCFP